MVKAFDPLWLLKCPVTQFLNVPPSKAFFVKKKKVILVKSLPSTLPTKT